MELQRKGDSGFLQSAIWESFQQQKGFKTTRIENEGFSTYFVEHALWFVGRYWYCPRGPIVTDNGKRITDDIENILTRAKKDNIGWIRIEPHTMGDLEVLRNNAEYLLGNGRVVKAPHDMQPKQTFCIDISKSEEDLLGEMKSKTRYNIRLAQKRGVKIVATNEKKYLDIFYSLVQDTSKRASITPHPLEHYEIMLSALPEENIKLYLAQYEDEIIAANLMIFFEDTVIYLHGGSSNVHRNVMAPFLLQWHAIRDAKERGCRWYDLGGVKGGDGENAWSGITRFKQGFSPETEPLTYPGTYDIVLKPWKYKLYTVLSKLRSI